MLYLICRFLNQIFTWAIDFEARARNGTWSPNLRLFIFSPFEIGLSWLIQLHFLNTLGICCLWTSISIAISDETSYIHSLKKLVSRLLAILRFVGWHFWLTGLTHLSVIASCVTIWLFIPAFLEKRGRFWMFLMSQSSHWLCRHSTKPSSWLLIWDYTAFNTILFKLYFFHHFEWIYWTHPRGAMFSSHRIFSFPALLNEVIFDYLGHLALIDYQLLVKVVYKR